VQKVKVELTTIAPTFLIFWPQLSLGICPPIGGVGQHSMLEYRAVEVMSVVAA